MSMTITPAALHSAVLAAREAIADGLSSRATGMLDALAAMLNPSHTARPEGRARRLVEDAAPRTTRPFGGSPVRTWTDERVAMLRERFPTSLDDAALLADLNALPAPEQINTVKGVAQKAGVLGIKRDAEMIRALRAKGGRTALALRKHIPRPPPPKWTAERLALITAEYPGCTDREGLLARVNALPGQPIVSVDSLRVWAKKMRISADAETQRVLRSEGGRIGGVLSGVVRRAAPSRLEFKWVSADDAAHTRALVVDPPEPEPEPERTPEEQAAIADAAIEAKHERVRNGLRNAMNRRGADLSASATALAVQNGLPLREAMRLLGEVRREGVVR
jgi:hypothetical protein